MLDVKHGARIPGVQYAMKGRGSFSLAKNIVYWFCEETG